MLRVDCCVDTNCASDDGSYRNGDAHCDGPFNCVGGNPITCEESEKPRATSVCSEAAQGCQDIPLDDGAECGTNDACVSNTCMSGTCISQDLSTCTGTCADCSGECVDPQGDLDNCGVRGHVCEDFGQCLTTACVQPGICLKTPVACPGTDQCNTATCNPDTGCHLQPITGASCIFAGSNDDTCGADGVCNPICLGTESCSMDDDCSENQHCFNGGCFTRCAGSCSSTSCTSCQCAFPPDRSANFVC